MIFSDATEQSQVQVDDLVENGLLDLHLGGLRVYLLIRFRFNIVHLQR